MMELARLLKSSLPGPYELGQRTILHGLERPAHRAFGLLGGVRGVLDIGAQRRAAPTRCCAGIPALARMRFSTMGS